MTPSSEPIGTKLIRVLVADDHALFREGLCSLLREARFEVVAEATTGLEALEATQTHSPDIVLMDVAMPGLSGLEAARRIRKACPATRVIALSVHGNEEYVIRALENGCAGYLSKGVRAGEIFAGIERVVAGGRAFDADALEAVIRAVLRLRSAADGTGGAKHQLITDREREILQLIAEGKSAKAIAAELGVSFKTVEIHRGNIMRKLDLHNSGELIKYAASRGFVVL